MKDQLKPTSVLDQVGFIRRLLEPKCTQIISIALLRAGVNF